MTGDDHTKEILQIPMLQRLIADHHVATLHQFLFQRRPDLRTWGDFNTKMFNLQLDFKQSLKNTKGRIHQNKYLVNLTPPILSFHAIPKTRGYKPKADVRRFEFVENQFETGTVSNGVQKITAERENSRVKVSKDSKCPETKQSKNGKIIIQKFQCQGPKIEKSKRSKSKRYESIITKSIEYQTLQSLKVGCQCQNGI